jgi:subtilisin family serine protease
MTGEVDMKSRIVVQAALSLALVASVAQAGTFRAAPPEKAVAGEYLVVLRQHAARLSLQKDRPDLPAVRTVAKRLSLGYGVKVDRVWDRALSGFVINATEAQARRLAADPLVESVEQNFGFSTVEGESARAGSCYGLDSYPYGSVFYHAAPTSSPQTLICSDPDPTHDTGSNSTPPLCQDNWGLDVVDQHSLTRNNQYTYTRTGSVPLQVNVTIFLLDTGVNAGHRDFLNSAGTASRVSGFDVTGDTSCAPTTDPIGHGTHVAGIAAGRMFGIAKDAYVVEARASTCTGATFETWIVDALNAVAGHRPAVVNWSGGNSQAIVGSTAIRMAVQGVVNSGMLVVQAAGNQSSPYPQPGVSPAVYPTPVSDACDWSFGGMTGVIIVGGVDPAGNRWTRIGSGDLVSSFCTGPGGDCGSNVGSCVNVWAPASNILSAGRYDTYGYCRLSGTSMAAPFVSGTAALYLQAHPLATPDEVKSAIIGSATTGLLNTNTSSPFHIGATSPNRLLYTGVP